MLRPLTLLALICGASGLDASPEARIAELERELAEVRRTSVPFERLIEDRIYVSIDLLGDDALLTPEAATFLNLTEDERQRIDACLEATGAAMVRAIAAAKPKARVDDQGVATIEVADFSTAGLAVRDRMENGIAGVIDGARLAFLTNNLRQRDGAFLDFGVGTTTLTVSVVEQGGSTMITTSHSHKSGNGSSSGSSTSTTFPDEHRLLLPYVPGVLRAKFPNPDGSPNEAY
jgi:hypothetical protein